MINKIFRDNYNWLLIIVSVSFKVNSKMDLRPGPRSVFNSDVGRN